LGLSLHAGATKGVELREGREGFEFQQIDWYVTGRLNGLMRVKPGRDLRADDVQVWTNDWFTGYGQYRL
jgi:RNA-directed DNA polymerase